MANRRTAPVQVTGDALRDIGGAIVRRRFTSHGKDLMNGMVLAAGEVALINPNNRKALIDNGFIQIFPKPVRSHLEADVDKVQAERHVVSLGFGRWDVIEGKKINKEPLTREQAQALAEPAVRDEPERPQVTVVHQVGTDEAPLQDAPLEVPVEA